MKKEVEQKENYLAWSMPTDRKPIPTLWLSNLTTGNVETYEIRHLVFEITQHSRGNTFQLDISYINEKRRITCTSYEFVKIVKEQVLKFRNDYPSIEEWTGREIEGHNSLSIIVERIAELLDVSRSDIQTIFHIR